MEADRFRGIQAALVSAFLLGLAPVFGRQAILLGLSPLAVVALRTGLAAGLLFLLVAIFRRQYLFIFPAGLIGCTLAGVINGLGSIFYYMSLARLPASIGQMLYSLYPIFLMFGMMLDRYTFSRLTWFRVLLAMVAVVLLSGGTSGAVDPVGIALMLVGSLFYAMHLPINQRVLYEAPAPTVTLYTLLAMSAVVIPAWALFDPKLPVAAMPWTPVIGLTLVTFFSRLALFFGVKKLGGLQTALLGLSELLVAITFSYIWLGERLTPLQWLGAGILSVSLLMVRKDQSGHPPRKGGWLNWISSPVSPPDIPWWPNE